MKLPFALFGTAFLIVGTAAYVYLNYCYKAHDAAIDLVGEHETDYL